MDTFKQRLPAKKDLFPLFSVCAFAIHIWAMLSIFVEVPSLLLRLDFNDFVGAIAYTLTFTLLESLLGFTIVLALLTLMPHKWRKYSTIATGTLILCILQYSILLVSELATSVTSTLLGLLGLLAIAGIFVQLMRRGRVSILVDFVDRLTVLTGLYITFDIIGLSIVIIRNIIR